MVLDAYSRRVVGWAIDRRCETVLVNDAVAMASGRHTKERRIDHPLGSRQSVHLVGVQRTRRGARDFMGSMGTIGDCYDNAPMESFWGSMQIELLNRKKWRTKIELSIAIAEWIEPFYNPERLHRGLLHDSVTTDLWCREASLGRMSPCPSPIQRSSATTS